MGFFIRWEQGRGLLSVRVQNRVLWNRPIIRELSDRIPHPTSEPPKESWRLWRPSLPDVLHFTGYLWRHIRVRSFSCDAVVGFPSASTTGMVYGYFQGVKGVLMPIPSLNLNMVPDFDRTVCNGRVLLELEVRYPLLLAFYLLRMIIRRPARDILFSRGAVG